MASYLDPCIFCWTIQYLLVVLCSTDAQSLAATPCVDLSAVDPVNRSQEIGHAYVMAYGFCSHKTKTTMDLQHIVMGQHI